MQKIILLLSLLAVANFAAAFTYDAYPILWSTWKNLHEKSYSSFEEPVRFAIFIENVNKITAFNAANDGTKLAINKFADLTGEEFQNIHASCSSKETDQDFIAANTLVQEIPENLPDSVDWRSKGAVTPVKDQGTCGACWAFSANAALEGLNFINTTTLLSFSNQQVIDCDNGQGDEGCGGGWPYLAVTYVSKNGIEVDTDYPYTGQQGTCRYNSAKAHNVTTGYKFVTANSTDQLKAAVVNQPVSVGIEADQDVLQFYKSGIVMLNCGNNIDHAVTVVGYHKIDLVEAWIVKNSWGTDWGEDGYVHIWTGKANNGEGVCGILSQPIVPVN